MMFIWCAIISKYQAQEPIKCCCNSILLALVSSTCQLWAFFMSSCRPELIQKQQGSAARRKGRFRQRRRGDICDIYGLQGGKQWDQWRQKAITAALKSVRGCRTQRNTVLFKSSSVKLVHGLRGDFSSNSLACKRGRLGCCHWPAHWRFGQKPESKWNNLIFSQGQWSLHLASVLTTQLWLGLQWEWCLSLAGGGWNWSEKPVNRDLATQLVTLHFYTTGVGVELLLLRDVFFFFLLEILILNTRTQVVGGACVARLGSNQKCDYEGYRSQIAVHTKWDGTECQPLRHPTWVKRKRRGCEDELSPGQFVPCRVTHAAATLSRAIENVAAHCIRGWAEAREKGTRKHDVTPKLNPSTCWFFLVQLFHLFWVCSIRTQYLYEWPSKSALNTRLTRKSPFQM